MNREKALAKNTLIISIGNFLPKFSSIITLPIITGGLTKVEMGTYDLISTLAVLFLPVATLQIQAAAFRFLIDVRGDEEETSRIITNIFLFILVTSIVALAILFLCLGKIELLVRSLICLFFFMNILLHSTQQIVRGLSNNMLYSASAIVCSLVNMFGILVCVSFLHIGLTGLLSTMIIANGIALVMLMIIARIHRYFSFTFFSVERLRTMLEYSWPLIPNSLLLWIMNLSDRLIITAYLGVEANAIYAVANKIPNLLTTIQNSFSAAWMENASLTVKDGDTEDYYSKMFDTIFCMVVGITAGLLAVTPILFKILIRGDYEDAYIQIPVLFAGMMFSVLSSFMGGIYAAHKKTKSVGYTTVVAAVFNMIINFTFIKKIGLYAASLSTFISYFLLVIFRIIDVQKFQKIRINWKKNIVYLATLIVMGIISTINNDILNFINLGLGCMIVFWSNKDLIMKMLSRLSKK
ncbi:oligosaccharide flippase family protein [Enterococcus faecium]|uniref:oligosaccharide flippase family protein n=1 Tax=Enterococcus faecium TaxID=1352 RepID=UPI003CC5EB27